MRLVDSRQRSASPAQAAQQVKLRTDAFVQVRMNSTRVPEKALVELAGEPCLQHVVDRIQESSLVRQTVICTSDAAGDDPLESFANHSGLAAFRGSAEDCIDRFWQCALEHGSDVIVRVCGDSPLISHEVMDDAISYLLTEQLDYVSTRQLPVGTYVEVFTAAALQRAFLTAVDRSRSDDLSFFLGREEINVLGEYLPPEKLRRPDLVLALNRPEDLEVLSLVFGKAMRAGELLTVVDAIEYLDDNPEVASMNSKYVAKPTTCDTRLDVSRLPLRPEALPWYAPVPTGGVP
jgi:spore coat polysaccharide biosynthesis protein SpsF